MRRFLGRAYLKLTGWRVIGDPPKAPKYIIVVAPHTSNWDFMIGLTASWASGLDVGFVAKQGLFRPPLGWLLKALGGIPVRRDRNQNLVEQIAAAYRRRDRLALAITPEGTRARTETWRSGFYHLATLAGIPIIPAYLDWPTKTACFGPALIPSGDVRADMSVLRDFYAGKRGRFPDQFGDVRLAEESDPQTP